MNSNDFEQQKDELNQKFILAVGLAKVAKKFDCNDAYELRVKAFSAAAALKDFLLVKLEHDSRVIDGLLEKIEKDDYENTNSH